MEMGIQKRPSEAVPFLLKSLFSSGNVEKPTEEEEGKQTRLLLELISLSSRLWMVRSHKGSPNLEINGRLGNFCIMFTLTSRFLLICSCSVFTVLTYHTRLQRNRNLQSLNRRDSVSLLPWKISN